MKHLILSFLVIWLATSPAYAGSAEHREEPKTSIDISRFVKADTYTDIKLSPDGKYYAMSVPMDDETALVVLDREQMKPLGHFRRGKAHIDDFWWANSTRLLFTMAEKSGSADQPLRTGEILAMNADGSDIEVLVGRRVQNRMAASRITNKTSESVNATLVDDLDGDDRAVVISVRPFQKDSYSRAERMDIVSGRRKPLASAPVRNASFVTDSAGVVRFAYGHDADLVHKLYYRSGDQDDWSLIGSSNGIRMGDRPIGFSGDNKIAYLITRNEVGPDSIVAFDTATRTRKEILRDKIADPGQIIYRGNSREPVGAAYLDGRPHTVFFEKGSFEERQYRSLEAAFPGQSVGVTSETSDGKLALVEVGSDRNPGDVYLFNNETKHAEHVLSRRPWLDPAQGASVRPVTLRARDGLALSGLLTLPQGRNEKSLPLVVMPHGGPFGVRDVWEFDTNAQILAAAGYAVLQVNFRGSHGYGKAFAEAGRREWGGKMQDDVTDATRWAIAQGIADPTRICIYGTSYGGYAALMGAAKEPELYRCAAGYVGVYDLPLMYSTGDVQERGSGESYLREWVGTQVDLEKVSPARLANRIKIPVFLAAGGEDDRAPIAHSEAMEKALRQAGAPVETLYYKNEGHGFFRKQHQQEFYVRLLAFLSRSLGGKEARITEAVNTPTQGK